MPAVGGVAKLFVGFYGVAAMVLEFIGAELCHEADATPFLLFIEQNARAFLANFAQGELKLEAAVAAQGAEDIAGEALRVNTDQWGRRVDISHDQGNQPFDSLAMFGGFFAAGARFGQMAFEAEDTEVSPASGEVGVGYLYYFFKTQTLFDGLG